MSGGAAGKAAALLTVSIMLIGCGSESPESVADPDKHAPPRSEVTSAADGLAASDLVAEWQRVTTCEERVQALRRAGLGRFAAEHAAGEGWIPGVTSPDQLEDPHQPCLGAVPLVHSHFFTEDGLFGSRDDAGNQVDDGTYRLPDDHTVVVTKEFGIVTFDFQIRNDALFLYPRLPECVKTGCFAAQWAVSVAYPGLPWKRAS
jgi:hypothetical protein